MYKSTESMIRRPDATIKPYAVLPAWASERKLGLGMDEMVDLRSLGIMPGVAGGDRGFHETGDLITQTLNGVNLNDLWSDYQDMLAAWNARRDPMLGLLTWRTTDATEELFQSGSQANFEEASEYGEPVGVRPKTTGYLLGYTFKWYDIGARYTWQFLADATSSQVDAVANMVTEADNRNVFNMVMKTIFNNVRRTNKEGATVYPFYAGAVGDQPPDYGTTTFADQHNHYVTTGNATLAPAHLETLQGLLTEHGYKHSNGYQLVLLINEAQEPAIRQFKSTANGGTGQYDFIPSLAQPTFLLPTTLMVPDGVTRPPATFQGIDVVGSYGQWLILKNEFIPAGYFVGFATGGDLNVQNPVAIREHTNASLRGLKLVKGRTPDYPLIDSFYNRGFGTGVRYRGASAVMQLTASGTYTIPAAYLF